jgi:UDP-N-acetylmuramate dehydrogenase
MTEARAWRDRLAGIPNLRITEGEPLARHTRFGIGGVATLFCDAPDQDSCVAVLKTLRQAQLPHVVIGGGTNLVVADAGFDGVVLRFSGASQQREGVLLRAEGGAVLQDVVDRSIALGLSGMQTMTGIPGYLGGAVYGNAGAYGQSIQERVETVLATDGERVVAFSNADCHFQYRESWFKSHKQWLILRTDLRFAEGDAGELRRKADEIRRIRDQKYPPAMKCAGSIFKNLFFTRLPANAQAEVPAKLVREGKVPSAWFLERAGVMGMRRGNIQVATYHANLIYNDGAGTAEDLVAVIKECKARVAERFGFELEEEVQYVGFGSDSYHLNLLDS